jgi:hypothetical protein
MWQWRAAGRPDNKRQFRLMAAPSRASASRQCETILE